PRVLSDLEGANELVAVDIDGDQDLDLVAGAFAYPSDLVWYENTNGQGNFASAQIIATGLNSVESIAIVDYDGDQDLDVVAHSVFDGVIFWCENTDGQGTFGETQPILAGLAVSPSLAIGDIDGNGTLDIAYASLTHDYVGWFADPRTSTAQPETISELGILGPDAVATFDADEDGDLDAVVAAVEDNAIVWFENVDGDGSFSEGILVDVLAGAIYVTPADFNADGRDDILAVGAAGTLAWYENLPGADFGPRQMLSDSLQGSEFATAMDVDGDGDFDVIATVNYEPNAQIVWYENTDGQGTFGGAHIVDEQLTSPREVAVADFDQDNDLDFAVASLFDNQIVIFTNEDGKGQFEIAQVIPTTQDIPVDVEAGDIDGDGDIDLTFMEFSGNSAAWIANDGSGTFGEPTTIGSVPAGPEGIDLADLDGDGDLDILISSLVDDQFSWLENFGNGNFNDVQIIAEHVTGASAIQAADIDGDGDLDVIATAYELSRVLWYRNIGGSDLNSDGQFDASDIDFLCEAVLSGANDLHFDYNDDGLLDQRDHQFFVTEIAETSSGDANLDGVFDSSDFVFVFVAGEYEDDLVGNSTWATGDWNCDGEFSSSDLVHAFQAGLYVGQPDPRAATALIA
ncbi:MAG: VCBS repeat-containing protein, partial [Planctomycetales bacterium]|nr:VCBS repeat-containing protein [Planctomycetales bacterium]